MKKFYALPILGAVAVSTSLCLSGIAAATDLETSMSNSSNWASQAGDYANHRYSTLDQINAKNVMIVRALDGTPFVLSVPDGGAGSPTPH
jgi:glucose dehydrogenase